MTKGLAMRVETGRRRVPLLLTKFRNPSEEPLKGIISPQAPPAKDQNQAGEDNTPGRGRGRNSGIRGPLLHLEALHPAVSL